MNDLSAFVLIGGRSSRMGQDKALLQFNGRSLLENALELARSVAHEVILVGSPSRYSKYGRTIPDIFPNCGPLGGIHAALELTRTDYNLVFSIDTPFLPARLMRYMCEEACRTKAVVTYPLAGGQRQPLCAVYRREFKSTAERALTNEQYKIEPLLQQVTSRIVNEDELTRLGITPDAFDNLNTPEDWQRVQNHLESKNG